MVSSHHYPHQHKWQQLYQCHHHSPHHPACQDQVSFTTVPEMVSTTDLIIMVICSIIHPHQSTISTLDTVSRSGSSPQVPILSTTEHNKKRKKQETEACPWMLKFINDGLMFDCQTSKNVEIDVICHHTRVLGGNASFFLKPEGYLNMHDYTLMRGIHNQINDRHNALVYHSAFYDQIYIHIYMWHCVC